MEERVYYVKNKEIIMNNENLKRKGFSYENSANVDYKKEGYVFYFKAEKEWFNKVKIESLKGVEEIKGDDKEKILKKINGLEDDVSAGIGGLF